MGVRDEDRATGVSSLTNEEPLVMVGAHVDVMREVVQKNGGNGRGSVVWEGETPLHCGRCRSVRQRAFGAEDGHIGCGWGICGHRGSEVFALRGSDEDVVGVDGDVLVEWGEKEGVENLLSNLGGSGRHHR